MMFLTCFVFSMKRVRWYLLDGACPIWDIQRKIRRGKLLSISLNITHTKHIYTEGKCECIEQWWLTFWGSRAKNCTCFSVREHPECNPPLPPPYLHCASQLIFRLV
uniref:Secreted protein n=1 Tax=Micrurus surinamensis TaxID=129470 RepID=A0A2D4PI48_MICSU